MPYSLDDNKSEQIKMNLLIVKVLQAALDLHVLVVCVSEGIFDAELQRLSCDAQILNMVILKLHFAHLFFFSIYQWLLLECFIDG